jgi:dTDP-4-dehydrorhamnose reductase
MKILLLGKNGQVGWELQRSLAPLGDLVALDSHSQMYCGDLSNLAGFVQTVRDIRPDVIVNAAAYTAVDKAESEPVLAHVINALAPSVLAQEAKISGAWLVHFSTDYVFDGSGNQPWLENDVTGPLNVYGASKLAGEQAIMATACNHLIFRTSWVYGSHGNNFAKKMLKHSQQHDSLKVVDDQIGAPTGADLLADVTAHAICTALNQPNVSGLYHLVACGETSWYEYAKFVIEFARQAGEDVKVTQTAIHPVSSGEFTAAAKRPLNSRLNTSKLLKTFNLHLPDWQSGVTRMLVEVLQK